MILVAVIPTLNEVGSLGRVAAALMQLEIPDVDLRLLVVDDASTDGTAALADDLARATPQRVDVLHRVGKHGLGSAYVDGFARALAGGADFVAQMDADLSHEPGVLGRMMEAIHDADVVIASRYVTGGGVDTQWPWHRKQMSWFANTVVVPRLLSLPVRDATSGYRLWRRDLLASIAPSVNVRSNGYGFQVEMAYLAHQSGSRITEVPIYFRERDAGESKMNVMEALTAMREIFAIPRQHRRRR